VEDPTGKAKLGHAALAPKPKLDIILWGVVLLSGQQREVKIESWLVEEKRLGIGKGTCLGLAEEFNEDEEVNVSKMDWCRCRRGSRCMRMRRYQTVIGLTRLMEGSVFFLPCMQLLRIATGCRRPNRPNQLELVRLGLLSFYP